MSLYKVHFHRSQTGGQPYLPLSIEIYIFDNELSTFYSITPLANTLIKLPVVGSCKAPKGCFAHLVVDISLSLWKVSKVARA